MRILITGSNGLLGQKLVDYCTSNKIIFLATSLGNNRNSKCPENRFKSLDVTNLNQIDEVCSDFKPTHIINTAALTNVDQCENDRNKCEKINVTAVGYLLDVAQKHNCHLQQLSTDFIFDGEKGNYLETDQPNPLNEYGKSKLKAEELILNAGYDNYSIVRTTVVYGVAENLSKSNIVLWALSELKKKNQLTIVNDQFRAPTFANDLANGCMKIIEKDKQGIFNIAGPKTYSIHELISQVAEYLDVPKGLVVPINSKTLNQTAKRPKNSGLNLIKAKKHLDYQPTSFKSSLFLIDVEN
ncbi:MAG: SDR family oxidoreductase [Brumimicrobium sp.]